MLFNKKIAIFLTLIMVLSSMPYQVYANNNIFLQTDKTYIHIKQDVDNIDAWESILSLYAAGDQFKNFDRSVFSYEGLKTPTDYGTTILSLVALDMEPREVNGRNLVEELAAFQKENGLFGTITDDVYAGLALEAVEGEYDVDRFIQALLTRQNEDKGFGVIENRSDVDTTALILMVLAHFQERENVSVAISKAVEFLHEQQLDSAGFGAWGTENTVSIAYTIIALIGVGQDIQTQEWLKSGNSMYDALLSFALEDGTFTWLKQSVSTNSYATRMALIALSDNKNDKAIYRQLDEAYERMSYSVEVIGIDEVVLKETVDYKYKGIREVPIFEAMERALDEYNVSYSVESLEDGKELTVINKVRDGYFNGSDHWQYAVNGIYAEDLSETLISDGDHIQLYYGYTPDITTIPEITIYNDEPKFLGKIRLKVMEEVLVDLDGQNGVSLQPVEGAVVKIGDEKALTDEDGIGIIGVSKVGQNVLEVFKNDENGVPILIRQQRVFDAVVESEMIYNDHNSIANWAKTDVYAVRYDEVMEGYQNQFNPKAFLTKAELLKVLLVAIDDHEFLGTPSFEDVKEQQWYYHVVGEGQDKGIVNKNRSSSFNGNSHVTREAFAEMIVNAFDINLEDYDSVDLSGYNDVERISSWAVAPMKVMVKEGILSGYNGELMPDGYVSREMCAVIIQRVRDRWEQ